MRVDAVLELRRLFFCALKADRRCPPCGHRHFQVPVFLIAALPIAFATRDPNSLQPILPPRSAVRDAGFASTSSTARSISAAAASSFGIFRCSPIHANVMAAERMREVGFALS